MKLYIKILNPNPSNSSNEEYNKYIQSNDYQLYITGSDAVFRLRPYSNRSDLNFPNPYWLPNISNTRLGKVIYKAAVAPSAMGSDYKNLNMRQQSISGS